MFQGAALGAVAELILETVARGAVSLVAEGPDRRCARLAAEDALQRVAISVLPANAPPASIRRAIHALDNAVGHNPVLDWRKTGPSEEGTPVAILRARIIAGLAVLYEPLDGTTQAEELGIRVTNHDLADRILSELIGALAANLTTSATGCRVLLEELRRQQDQEVARATPIQTRYLVCRSFEVLAEISDGDLSSVPGSNTMLVPTPVLSTWQRLRTEQGRYRRPQAWGGAMKDKASYLTNFPTATEIDPSHASYPVFETHRAATEADLAAYVIPQDALSRHLRFADLPADAIAEVLAYLELCGSRGPEESFQELVRLREVWGVLLQVSALESGVVLERLDGITYDAGPVEANERRTAIPTVVPAGRFPSAPLSAGESVLIPLATVVPPLGFEPLATYWSDYRHDLPKEWVPELSGAALEVGLAEFLALGPFSEATEVQIARERGASSIAVHRFDPRRTYILSAKWFAGSCPHLFEVVDGKLMYVRPLFGRAARCVQTELHHPSLNWSAIIVAELEDEVTMIQAVRKGSRQVCSNITLKPGELLTLTGEGSTEPVMFEGSYSPFREDAVDDGMLERNRRVAQFMEAFSSSSSGHTVA